MKTPTVIFEDNHLLIVDKPSGMLTQPTDKENDSVESWAKAWIKKKYAKPGNVFLHAVHRLDKPVSGLVVFAKTSKALSRLNESMRSKECVKLYHARVEGCVKSFTGTLEHFLTHDEYRAQAYERKVPGSLKAILHYKIIEKGKDHTLLEIRLETGRYHQIRAQLAAIGHPIVGDTKYGANGNGETITLRHISLTIPHPITQEPMTFVVA